MLVELYRMIRHYYSEASSELNQFEAYVSSVFALPIIRNGYDRERN